MVFFLDLYFWENNCWYFSHKKMAMNEYRECPSVIEDDACEASTVTEEEGSDDEFLRYFLNVYCW